MRASIGSPVLMISMIVQVNDCIHVSYSSASSHGAQQAAVDFDDLLHRLTGDPVARCCSRVCGNNDAALEAEGECGGSVGNLDGAIGVAVIVRHRAQPVLG